MEAKVSSLDVQKVEVVNLYATPLAILLVVSGLVLTQPRSPVMQIASGLLIVAIAFNTFSARVIAARARQGASASFLLRSRLYFNLLINILLVYYLGGFWHPMWLLLSLTPLATAIYGGQRQTLNSGLTVAAILIGIHFIRGNENAPIDWGVVMIQSVYVILTSLLVNALVGLVRPAPQPAA